MRTAARARADEILARLPNGPIYGAELGVWDGRLSQLLLLRENLTLLMVDAWAPLAKRDQTYIDSGDIRALCPDEEMEQAHRQALTATAFAGKRASVLRMDTLDAAMRVPNRVLDFCFIDADHSLAGVITDIAAWYPKVKAGGWICGHDYGDPQFPGVAEAVDTVFRGKDIEVGDNMTWFVRC